MTSAPTQETVSNATSARKRIIEKLQGRGMKRICKESGNGLGQLASTRLGAPPSRRHLHPLHAPSHLLAGRRSSRERGTNGALLGLCQRRSSLRQLPTPSSCCLTQRYGRAGADFLVPKSKSTLGGMSEPSLAAK